MMAPRVSIVMPYRNAAATLPAALAGIAGQTFGDWELLAVDDHSSDGSTELVAAMAARDRRVRPLSNEEAPGVVGASVTASRAAETDWLARMDADDVSEPERLAAQWAMALERPDLDVIGCGVGILSPLGEGMVRHVEWVNSLTSPEEIARARFIENPLVHPSALMRKSSVEAAGGYLDVPWAEDHDLFLRMLEGGARFGKVAAVLMRWRDSPGRLTRSDPRYGDAARHRMRVHYLARMPVLRERGVAIAGAGPIGKTLALGLRDEGIAVRGFFDVHPRRIGETIHGAEVAGLDRFGSRWRDAVLLSAVGVPGGREEVAGLAERAGYGEGRDFWCVC
jgi:glycosyltransferase involved in cell wall biosynthesis